MAAIRMRFFWGTLWLSCMLLCELHAQVFVNQQFSFERKGRKHVTLDFKVVHNLVIIPLFINGSDTLNFILDTGVDRTVITSFDRRDTLSLHDAVKMTVQGLGEDGALEAYQSRNNEIRLPGGIVGDNQNVLLLTRDIFRLSQTFGMPIHGLIGGEVFRSFVVRIDYRRKRLTFIDPERYRRRKTDGKTLAVDLIGGKPYIDLTAYLPDSTGRADTVPVRLLIDSGASFALSLYEPTSERIQLPEKRIAALLGVGLSGEINGHIGRVPGLCFGGYAIDNVVANYPSPESVAPLLKSGTRNGSLGSQVLKRFRVTYDYPRNRIMVKPNANLRKPFEYNVSGMELVAPIPGLPIFVIADVREGSPADLAGLRRGDQILRVNDRKVGGLTLSEVVSGIREQAGQKLSLHVDRNDVTLKFSFKLTDTLEVRK